MKPSEEIDEIQRDLEKEFLKSRDQAISVDLDDPPFYILSADEHAYASIKAIKIYLDRQADGAHSCKFINCTTEKASGIEDRPMMPTRAQVLEAVHSGKVLTTFNLNDSGILLWKCLWKWTAEEGYQSKVCASGCFVGWETWTEEEFIDGFLKSATKFPCKWLNDLNDKAD